MCLCRPPCRAVVVPVVVAGGFTTAALLFSTTRDGKDSKKFHSLCDGQGPTVTLIRTVIGGVRRVYGGYVHASWSSANAYIRCPRAAVFSVLCSEEDRPTLYAVYDEEVAIFGDSSNGPVFGYNTIGLCDTFRGLTEPIGYYNVYSDIYDHKNIFGQKGSSNRVDFDASACTCEVYRVY